MKWFRFHADALFNDKVQQLPPELFKVWVNLLCVMSIQSELGSSQLPAMRDLARYLARRKDYVERDLAHLLARGLLDRTEDGLIPHNWLKRQYKSDSSTPRVKMHRWTQRNVSFARDGNVSKTDQIQIQSKKEEREERKKDNNPEIPNKINELPLVAAKAAPTTTKYAFEYGVIRLNARDLALWTEAFSHLDLKAELVGMQEWASKQANWFCAVSAALAKKNREVKKAVAEAKVLNGKHLDSTQPEYWTSGIVGVT